MEARVLIDAERIRSIARDEKMGAAVVEKDYALTWLLKGFYLKESQLRKNFVLKGGTAIRKAYFLGTWRFSEDLDFTVTGGDTDAEVIKSNMQDILDMLTAESAIAYSIHSFHANPGAVIGSIRFQGPLNYPNKIKLDISLSEKMALKPEKRTVKSDFPDLHDFQILAYSLNEILTEKLRSIMQRGYSRDYYDVWRLMRESKFDRETIKNLLVRKCELKGIEYQPELFFDNERLDDASDHWIAGLGHLMKEVPDFDKVVSELEEMLAFFER